MINVICAGVGGQGIVLAAKVLAYAAALKGWRVRTAETIGMAQRGGSVVSHVRIANRGEEIHAPLVTPGTADMILAFEPGEAARSLPYLSRTGTVISAITPIPPVSASLGGEPYDVQDIIKRIQVEFYNKTIRNNINTGIRRNAQRAQFLTIDDAAVIAKLDGNRKVLNTVMLASASLSGVLPFTADELKAAIRACVKPEHVPMNLRAIDIIVS